VNGTEETLSAEVIELAEKIKEKGQASASDLPDLLQKAEDLAQDAALDVLSRALAHRAAGNARQLLNQFSQALESYNRAEALLETVDEPVELGRTLHAKVGMLFTLSRFDELFECSSRARELFERCSDRKRLARLDVNLAHAYHRLGQPKEALACSKRALEVLEEVQDFEGLVVASINSAVTLTAMHEFERAEERYRGAMRVARRFNMASWILLSQYNLAYLRYLSGDSTAALEEIRTLRFEYERSNEEWMICKCWLDESEILLELGDLEDSITAALRARAFGKYLGLNSEIGKSFLYEAAAKIRLGKDASAQLDEAARRFAADGDPISTAAAKLQTALLRAEGGNLDALQDALSARQLLNESGLPHLKALAEIVVGRIERARGNLPIAINAFNTALSLAEHSGSEWMQFHAAYELGLSLHSSNKPVGLKMLKRADGLFDSLWSRIGFDDLKMTFLADRDNVYTFLVRSTVADSTSAALDYSEKARSRVLRERLLSEEAPTSSQQIQSRLSFEEAIVEYFISGDDLFIFVIRRDALICIPRPGVVPGIRAEWENLDRHIESCSVKWEYLTAVHHHLQLTADHHLKKLYAELIGPIDTELRQTVIFVPHGFLHGVPIHALHNGEEYIADRFRIAYSPNAALYCNPAQEQRFDRPLLVAFSTTPASASIDEVQSLSSTSGATTLVNPTIDELDDALSTPRELIHIAGHAGIDAIGGKLSWIETPAGRITSRDLANMHIRARTIVITGCRTARRIVQPGDEWLGLMRSFYLSGASTIVSALWDIRDEAARKFAREFYSVFNRDNALSALQRAVAAVRQRCPHPYFWAGFSAFVRKPVNRSF
jgi:CHAT domain-containing protein